MPAASIQFSQGMTTTPAGQSALGYVTGTQVNFTDAAGGGATSWQWTIVGFPAPLSSPPTINNATTQTANINAPTLDGVYIIKLVRTDPGPVVTTDVRFFAIGDADYGLVLPSAGMTGNMTNIGGSAAAQAAGWEGRADAGTNVFIDAVLRFLRSRIGRFLGPPDTMVFPGGSPVTETITDLVDRGYRRYTLTGTGLYTAEMETTANPGSRFKFRVSIAPTSGGFVLKSGVGGTTILALVAPPVTAVYAIETVFNGTAWEVLNVSLPDPLAQKRFHEVQGVSGLQSTSQTVATRIGAFRLDPSKFPAGADIRFQVAVETTTPQVTIQLYNLTDSGIVSGSVLTSTSLTTTILTSSALTLPNSQKDYEVQMFIAAGAPSDHGDCTSAKVILTWA